MIVNDAQFDQNTCGVSGVGMLQKTTPSISSKNLKNTDKTHAFEEVLSRSNARTNEDIAQTNSLSSSSNNVLPLEAYSLPAWYTPYISKMSYTPHINSGFWEYAEEVRKEHHSPGEERDMISTYLDHDPLHKAELERERLSEKYRKELLEYNETLHNHFKEALAENGIDSDKDYYEKVILDARSSEKVHQSMQSRLEKDPRLLELMGILGTTL